MKNLFKSIGAACLLGATLVSCNQPAKEYQVADNGVKFKFYTQNAEAKKPVDGQFVDVLMDYRLPDTVLFSYKDVDQKIQFPIQKPIFKGDLFTALTMMGVGDSASFEFSADSIFTKMFGFPQLPPFVKAGDAITFDIKLKNILTQEEFEAEQLKARETAMKKQQELANERRDLAPTELANYIQENNITTTPDADGLYVIVTKHANGAKPNPGDKVSVHYTGKLLDGTVFDSSVERGDPIVFTLGEGQVIKGWDQGISQLRKGEKATLIIPYELAYGERATGPIPPYSNLVFDVELVDIIK